VEPSIVHLAPFVWSNGGEVVSHPTHPAQFTLDTAPALEAMQAFFDLRRKHLVVPTERERELEDDETRFRSGRLAMLLSTRRATPLFRTIDSFAWDVAMLPILREPRGILDTDGLCLAESSGEKDAAWRFLEFALGPEGQRVSARAGGTVPTLTEVAESAAFLDPSAKPANSRVFVDPLSRSLPSISTWPEIEAAAQGHLEAGLYGGVPVREVARRLTDETKPLFARAG
jgi:multiple sugar transport system substrate-binding protein